MLQPNYPTLYSYNEYSRACEVIQQLLTRMKVVGALSEQDNRVLLELQEKIKNYRLSKGNTIHLVVVDYSKLSKEELWKGVPIEHLGEVGIILIDDPRKECKQPEKYTSDYWKIIEKRKKWETI